MSSPAEVFLAQATSEALRSLSHGPGRAWAPPVDPCIAVAVRDDMRPTDLPFVDELVTAMVPIVEARSARLVRLYGHTDDAVWTLADYVRRWRLSGMVLVSLHSGDPLPKLLFETGFPVVTVGESEVAGIPFVEADNRGGARTATAHLLKRGARRVAAIVGSLRQHAMRERLEGYREAVLAATGAPPDPALIESGLGTTAGGASAMRGLLDRVADLDAVFVSSDLMAAGALGTLDAAGVPVPGQLRFVSFDDTPEARSRRLTVVSQPVDRMGEEVARLIVRRLDGLEGIQNVLVPTELIARASS